MENADEQKEKENRWRDEYGLADNQIAELKEVFAMFDANNDGVISYEEIGTALRALGQNPTEAEVAELMDKVDKDENGVITIDEFMRVLGDKGLKDELEMNDELEEAFRVFDKNGLGYIEVSEFKQVMATLGEPISDEDIHDMMKVADVSKDGKLNYLEFVRTLTSK